MEPTPAELRVLGCLLEKQRTTPDQYPLTLNALRLACNQATNRDPVVDFDEHTVREAAQALGRRRWSRLASGQGSRAPKYRHLLDEALGIGGDELAVLCVLMLRGPQTPGELKTRTERLHRFTDLPELHFTLSKMIGRGHVARMERRPGQKEERYRHLLGGDEESVETASSPVVHHIGPDPTGASAPTEHQAGPDEVPAVRHFGPDPGGASVDLHGARIDALEERVRELEAELRALREALGA